MLVKCNIAASEAISIAELKDGDPQWQRDGGIGNAERRPGLSRREKKIPVQMVTPWACSYSILLEVTGKHVLGP